MGASNLFQDFKDLDSQFTSGRDDQRTKSIRRIPVRAVEDIEYLKVTSSQWTSGLIFLLWMLTGIKKARVLPLPVLAAPKTSRLARASGRALRWISVSWVKPAFLRPSLVLSERGRSLKYFESPNASYINSIREREKSQPTIDPMNRPSLTGFFSLVSMASIAACSFLRRTTRALSFFSGCFVLWGDIVVIDQIG